MTKEIEVSQEEINKALDVLIILKARSDNKQPLFAQDVAKEHGLNNYVLIGAAFKKLPYIKRMSGSNRVEVKLTTVEPTHARSLITTLIEVGNEKYAKKVIKVSQLGISTPAPVEVVKKPITKSNQDFQIVSAKEIMFSDAEVIFHGHKIAGDFTLTKL